MKDMEQRFFFNDNDTFALRLVRMNVNQNKAPLIIYYPYVNSANFFRRVTWSFFKYAQLHMIYRNKTQTAVTNICLNWISLINLTFRMLEHTSSEVIIIQLQINLNSKIQLRGLGTNEID